MNITQALTASTLAVSTDGEVELMASCVRAIALETARRAAISASSSSRSERIAAIVRGELPELDGRRLSPIDR